LIGTLVRGAWKALFLTGAPAWIQVPANALAGRSSRSSRSSVRSARPARRDSLGHRHQLRRRAELSLRDLIVLPLLDVYRKYYGLKMAIYIGVVFFVTMVATGFW